MGALQGLRVLGKDQHGPKQTESRARCDLRDNSDINKGYRRTGKEEINVSGIWNVLLEEKCSNKALGVKNIFKRQVGF